ncbi:hypothetical protein KGQ64_00870 [bacterium]|nr:hypothetical protein [bacterium]
MNSEKDRLGDKLHDVEKAREDLFFAQRDRELLEKLRAGSAAAGACPTCGAALESREEAPLRLRVCPAGHGGWIATEDRCALAEAGAAAAFDRACDPALGRR